MTIDERKLWYEGRDLHFEYARVNGYSWTTNQSGLEKLSRMLDLNIPYISKRIDFYINK